MKPNNSSWVNTAKCIGIIAVILGHIASPLTTFIYSWHIPLFFILSGFFIDKNKATLDFISKNILRLMVPYFLFALLAVVVEAGKRALLNRNGLDWYETFVGVIWDMDISSLSGTYAFVLWFLPALLWARVLVFLSIKYVSAKSIQILIVLGLFILSFKVQLPFALDEGMNAIIFVYIGTYAYNCKINLIPVILLLLVTLIFIGILPLNMAYKEYSNIVINLIWAISFSYLLIYLLKKYTISFPLINLWGQNTMILFIIHPYTNNLASVFVNMTWFGNWGLKLAVSLFILYCFLKIKEKLQDWAIFKYV